MPGFWHYVGKTGPAEKKATPDLPQALGVEEKKKTLTDSHATVSEVTIVVLCFLPLSSVSYTAGEASTLHYGPGRQRCAPGATFTISWPWRGGQYYC